VRLLTKHRASLDRVATALLQKETLGREEMLELLEGVEPESRASETSARRGSSPLRAKAADFRCARGLN
jgi:hypothetical protein